MSDDLLKRWDSVRFPDNASIMQAVGDAMAVTIRQQQETIERYRKLLTTCADALSPLANCPLSKGRAIVIPGERCRKEGMSAMLAARAALENTND